MKERPILMSAPMVRALLAGTKTQTRRVLRNQPRSVALVPSGNHLFDYREGYEDYERVVPVDKAVTLCPYGRPGNRLWVRETWGYRCSASTATAGQYMHTVVYRADDARHNYGPMPMDDVGLPRWRERKEGEAWPEWDDYMTAYWRQWRPSIFMPRWACRITLEITEVRVQRLQDISEEDAKAEGIGEFIGGWACLTDDDPQIAGDTPQDGYRHLWERINGAGSWGTNPWVWCLSFKRIAS